MLRLKTFYSVSCRHTQGISRLMVRTSHGERGQSKYQASPATLGIETTWAAALRKETAHDADAPLAKAAHIPAIRSAKEL